MLDSVRAMSASARSRSRSVGNGGGRGVARCEVVMRDGVELPEDQARALWRAFREHLEHSPEDTRGFARAHGFADVRAESRRGRAVLTLESAVEASLSSKRSPGPARAKATRSPPPPARLASSRSARAR
ncbi:MAG: hypothetical protein ACHREM_14995 [Polyangiales bacterium]